MQFIIYGEDIYRSKKAVRAASDRFSATRDAVGLNVRTLVAGKDDVMVVREELVSSPFLAERKMVIAEGYCSESDEDQAMLVEALVGLPESTVAVFFEAEAGKELAESPLFVALAKEKYSVEYGLLSPVEAAKVVVADATALGVTMQRWAAEVLIGRIGTDGWALNVALAKLVAVVKGDGRGEILESDVLKNVASAAVGDENVLFPLLDAVVAGNMAEVASRLMAVHEAGMHPLPIIAALAKQVRAAMIAADMAGVPAAQIAQALDVKPFVAQKAMVLARRGPSELASVFERLVMLDMGLKSSGADEVDVQAVLMKFAAPVPR